MDNIEQALDNFFQRLGHTPGPWKYTPHHFDENEGHLFFEGVEEGPCTINLKGAVAMSQEELNIHGRLIAQSPAMLRTLCRTYLWMLTNLTYGTPTATFRIKSQEILAGLVGQISEATGIDHQQVQETFEQYATWITTGDLLYHPDFTHRRQRDEPADQRDPEERNAGRHGWRLTKTAP